MKSGCARMGRACKAGSKGDWKHVCAFMQSLAKVSKACRSLAKVGEPEVSGLQKGPAERGHVKKRQKSSKSVKKFFDTFRQFSRRAKNVKNRQKVSKSFSTIFARHLFSGPFCNPLRHSPSFQ